MDILVPSLLVGQIIGRFGCIINGDAAGGLTTLPWGFIYVHPGASISPDFQGVATHPYPVYEMLWNGAVLAMILTLRKRLTKEGSLFASYLALYALGRLVLTTVRQEPVLFLGLQEAQLLAVAAWALAGTIIFRLYRHYKVTPGGVT
jgi:phosphatidylglycerol:prolipoprotein diacylglycerol transferase